MPLIVFDGPELPKEKKAELVSQFTESASEITGMPKDAFIVLIKENPSENVGLGGTLISDRE